MAVWIVLIESCMCCFDLVKPDCSRHRKEAGMPLKILQMASLSGGYFNCWTTGLGNYVVWYCCSCIKVTGFVELTGFWWPPWDSFDEGISASSRKRWSLRTQCQVRLEFVEKDSRNCLWQERANFRPMTHFQRREKILGEFDFHSLCALKVDIAQEISIEEITSHRDFFHVFWWEGPRLLSRRKG